MSEQSVEARLAAAEKTIGELEERVRFYRDEWDNACERESFLAARQEVFLEDRKHLMSISGIYRTALEWYANLENYADGCEPGHETKDGWIFDQGRRAREALATENPT